MRVRAAQEARGQARNPILWADVPDPAVIRVGDTYYMSSTTMHLSPGLPILKSKDLVNWQLVSYAYDILEDEDALALRNGKNAYGRGSWASSLRYHDGTFFVTTFSGTTGKTYVYRTRDPEKGRWEETSFRPALHDPSLFFEDDGRVYMIHGSGNIRLTELDADLSGIKRGGVDQVIIPNAGAVAGPRIGLPAEGSQMRKIGGKYYVMNITWPRGGMRTQIIHRADTLTGPYEGRVALQDQGVAQGGLIDTPGGVWYALLFQDHGAVGRTPVPRAGEVGGRLARPGGRWQGARDAGPPREHPRRAGHRGLRRVRQGPRRSPASPGVAVEPQPRSRALVPHPPPGIPAADHRAGRRGPPRRPEHAHPADLRPGCCAGRSRSTRATMKDGDIAGLAAFQKRYGFVGVKMAGNAKSIVMVSAESDAAVEVERVPLTRDRVFLKLECDFENRADEARFFYSLDGKNWAALGKPLRMTYTLPHFMGYRFALFHFATRTPGGFVDFDSFHISGQTTGSK